MLTPDQIRRRALNRYEDFLRSLCTGEPFFPLNVFGGGLAKPKDFVADRAAIEALRKQSKEQTGFGYDIIWEDRNFRRLGTQNIPSTVAFTTQEDYTRFLNKLKEVREFQADYHLIQTQFPELVLWAQAKPLKVVAHTGEWDGLFAVCAYLRKNGRPNCYLRELPVEVDTKFIERKRGVLNELLPIVAPDCVAPDGMSFEKRFGFRQKQPLVRFRFLDAEIPRSAGLPFCDFAIPLNEAESLRPLVKNIIVVENEMNFLTLPLLPKTLALFGGGDAVSHLCRLSWLANARLVYWGDMDTHGFESLSVLRSQHPHAESVMMDNETFIQFKHFSTKAAVFGSRAELKLSDSERELFDVLYKDEKLLEQERIPLSYATRKLQSRLSR
ncbi:MAG TPA: DUF3322 domain-containing protein [Verrucomicrobiae bacterium]|jgi:hypothetical protein|nr:DUF3322 domain-containing protein [Verrucomicrobiae bacterium]